MPDYTVIRYGTDSSGRAILMTRYMRDVWEMILAHPDVQPFAHKLTIVQGAFMSRLGGGAEKSAGVHNEAGCIDTRTWNLTADELDTFIRVTRLHGWAFWRRDSRHGMAPHAHGVLGTDHPLASGAANQWTEYLNGGDGLVGTRPDYEWRPSPLVTRPPEDDMPYSEADLERIIAKVIDAKTPAIVQAVVDYPLGNGMTFGNNVRRGGDAKTLAQEIRRELSEHTEPPAEAKR